MERDVSQIAVFDIIKMISTHTLTWSVTIVKRSSAPLRSISTHTLTWSVTDLCAGVFNIALISTHTLTWSVTTRTSAYILTIPFQLTRSRGA